MSFMGKKKTCLCISAAPSPFSCRLPQIKTTPLCKAAVSIIFSVIRQSLSAVYCLAVFLLSFLASCRRALGAAFDCFYSEIRSKLWDALEDLVNTAFQGTSHLQKWLVARAVAAFRCWLESLCEKQCLLPRFNCVHVAVVKPEVEAECEVAGDIARLPERVSVNTAVADGLFILVIGILISVWCWDKRRRRNRNA